MYNKILVPFDQSASSSRALHHAAELAKTISAEKLTILMVNHHLPVEEFSVDVDIDKLLDEENAEALNPAIDFLKESGVNFEVHIKDGMPAQVILEYANNHHYPLIVMGRSGKGVLKHAILGSVSNRVLHETNCPVLIVR
ncbi:MULTISPECIES: universal stress protein [unclassified Bacillus (in: firmicutes)]|uniref:universal stress protein n=1 Tax=unclassified Bacillus (in: firmicutes) TaxID=185979 RepID=UPI000BEF51AC|nr:MULTISPECIES: universal stress protein [unclassified Bacillus (in: firmicutes)]PEJ46680.1 universal stress protein [Bacillus sp. AFS002410]PEL07667.1 universal stress protein [Bacillus sp. AFS017336]